MKNRKRNRILGYDYSQNNLYFVTICVQNRICCFGNVGTGRDLSVHHPNGNHPNGNHSNVDIKNEFSEVKMNLNEYGKIADNQWEWLRNQYSYVVLHSYIIMPNHVHAILEIDNNLIFDETIKIKSLSELIGAYKTTSSKQIHLAGMSSFAWQRSFHDHIIRNELSYEKIFNYIETNPDRWEIDTFFEN